MPPRIHTFKGVKRVAGGTLFKMKVNRNGYFVDTGGNVCKINAGMKLQTIFFIKTATIKNIVKTGFVI